MFGESISALLEVLAGEDFSTALSRNKLVIAALLRFSWAAAWHLSCLPSLLSEWSSDTELAICTAGSLSGLRPSRLIFSCEPPKFSIVSYKIIKDFNEKHVKASAGICQTYTAGSESTRALHHCLCGWWVPGTPSPGTCTYEQQSHTLYQVMSNTRYQIRVVNGFMGGGGGVLGK